MASLYLMVFFQLLAPSGQLLHLELHRAGLLCYCGKLEGGMPLLHRDWPMTPNCSCPSPCQNWAVGSPQRRGWGGETQEHLNPALPCRR
jgi:hypothetical protein